jgi:cysteine synthase A
MANPGGSSKDRVAKQIVLDAEASGKLKPGSTIVEGTSGSTGISLTLIATARGYKCRIFMPDDQAMEKTNLLRLLGAEVERVPVFSFSNNKHYCNLASNYANNNDGVLYADQFETDSNFKVHFNETGPEIWNQTEGKVDAFVMSAGTGGTIAGVSCYLKDKNPNVEVFLADPPGSCFYHRVMSGVVFTKEQQERTLRRNRYDTIVEGVGLDRLTANFAKAKIDKAFRCSDQEVVSMSRFILSQEGIFIGSSTALNLVATVRAAREMGPGHNIVTILCDNGNRHVSRFWNDDFISSKGLSNSIPDSLNFIM